MKYATEYGVAPEGVGRNARMFSGVENKEKRPLKVDEFGLLVEVCVSLGFQVVAPYLLPLVVVGAFAGLRPSELIRLAKEDVDLEIGIIWVRQSKTPSGIRYLPLKKEALEVLQYWLPRTKGKWVFPSPKKPGAHIKDFGKAFDRAVKEAGLQGITPDCLRHTFATEANRRVRRRSDLREMMGHSNDRHTAPYLHQELEDKRAAIEALPVPANFTTVLEKWKAEPRQEERQVRGSQGVEMVGPWGLEPQTSTVSR
ncbi:MAG: site-specific integrase [Acidobacteriia bacterium]|nr:site-specific integrase [Terriglobia bacterium]